jgi:uncharacterized protein YuzE
MSIAAHYDTEADALYIRLSDEARERTVEIDETTYVDVDADGHPVGIELLYPSMGIELDAVAARFHLIEQLPQIVAAVARSGAPVSVPTVTVSSTHLASSSMTSVRIEGTVPGGESAAAVGTTNADRLICAGA